MFYITFLFNWKGVKMKYFLIIIIVLIALLFIYSFIEQQFIETSSYILTYDNFPSETPLNIIVLADLHNRSFGKNNISLVKKIDEVKPDFILLAGDMVTKHQLAMDSKSYKLIRDLSKRYKIYYGYGNHEQKLDELAGEESPSKIKLYNSWKEYKTSLIEEGIIFLDNTNISYSNSDNKNEGKKIKISGLTIDLDYYKPFKEEVLEENYLESLKGDKDKSSFDIVIAHNPLYFPDYAKWGFDLIVSGHVHGGLVRLPFTKGILSPQIKLFPKYSGGEYSIEKSKMILSRGLGSHSFMPRIFNRPELVNIIVAGK